MPRTERLNRGSRTERGGPPPAGEKKRGKHGGVAALAGLYLLTCAFVVLVSRRSGVVQTGDVLRLDGCMQAAPAGRERSIDNGPLSGAGDSAGTASPVSRSFFWKDPASGDERNTVFQLDERLLKNEIAHFGQSPGMDDAMMIAKRGFKVVGRNNVLLGRRVAERLFTIVDYRQVYERNLPYFPPLTRQLLESIPQRNGGDSLHPILAFVQHIAYRRPPDRYRGKFIGSFFIPLVCLYEQYGDCDSKSVLLAEFLGTLPQGPEKTAMVLIYGKGIAHALLGVKRKPLPGMTSMFLEKNGYYIVLETTRPGWSPGFIDRRLTEVLQEGCFKFEILN